MTHQTVTILLVEDNVVDREAEEVHRRADEVEVLLDQRLRALDLERAEDRAPVDREGQQRARHAQQRNRGRG
mgnify:CR=1 FL=1